MIPDKAAIERVSPTAIMESNLEWVLGAELEQVRRRMHEAVQSEYPFLNELLAEHVHQHYPRAIIVLGVSLLGHVHAEKRVALATAIEMLHLAVNVHGAIPRDLVEVTATHRMMLGSSILVGDYCFSQASILAAETGNPAVAAAFANALAQLAERRVITLREHPDQPHTDDAILYAAAAEAGALLAGLPRPIRYALREAAAAFGEVLTDSETALIEALAQLDALIQDRPFAKPLVNWLRSRQIA